MFRKSLCALLATVLAVASIAGCGRTDGRYAVAAGQGLLPGTYRVRVFWPQSTESKPDGLGPPRGAFAPPPQERIPDRYNMKSELTVEIQANSANRFDFDLSTAAR